MHVCPHVRYVRIIPAQLYTYTAAASHVSAKLAGRVAPSTKCRTENNLFSRHRATHLNPVFRSIAPQNNNPKNLPVHGLNVIAFARIQTSSNGGFATRRKGRYAPLSAVACGPALTPLRSKTPHTV